MVIADFIALDLALANAAATFGTECARGSTGAAMRFITFEIYTSVIADLMALVLALTDPASTSGTGRARASARATV